MTTFVSLAELARFMEDDDVQFSLNAELVLEAACQAVRDFLDLDIDYVADDTYTTLPGQNTDIIRLPQWPVVALTEIVIDGYEDALVVDEDYELIGRVLLRRLSGGEAPAYWYRHERVTVTYSHGWATTLEDVGDGIERVPAPIRYKALELAAAGLTAATTGVGQVESETIGGYSYTSSTDSGAGIVLREEDAIGILRYRLEDVA